MSKRIVSYLLSMLFLLFIVAPSVILMVDDSVDLSVFYSASEEEEKGSEANIDLESLFLELVTTDIAMASFTGEDNLEYFLKKHPKPHLNLISPPPDYHIF